MTFAPFSSSRAPELSERARSRKAVAGQCGRRLRSAKIVATVGPACDGRDRLRALFEAGVDVFRLNFSHGSHDQKRAWFEDIRQVEAETGRPIGILADLQGPKLRLGDFVDGSVELAPGARFRVDLDPAPGDHAGGEPAATCALGARSSPRAARRGSGSSARRVSQAWSPRDREGCR